MHLFKMRHERSQSEGPKKEFDDFKASIQFVCNENDPIKSTMKVAEENVKKLTKKLEVVEIDMYDQGRREQARGPGAASGCGPLA